MKRDLIDGIVGRQCLIKNGKAEDQKKHWKFLKDF